MHEKLTIRESHLKVEWAGLLWFSSIVPRFFFITWMALRKAPLIQDVLVSCGIISRSSCCLCRMHVEDHDHLFFWSSYSKKVWRSILGRCRSRRRGQFTGDKEIRWVQDIWVIKILLAEFAFFLCNSVPWSIS